MNKKLEVTAVSNVLCVGCIDILNLSSNKEIAEMLFGSVHIFLTHDCFEHGGLLLLLILAS